MKKILLVLFVFSFSLCEGQSWLWAKEEVNHQNGDSSLVDPEDLTTDNLGNIYETGNFGGKVSFGTINFYSPQFLTSGFLVKFDNSGTPLWGIAESTQDYADGISVATGKNNNVCLTGNYIDTMVIGSFTFPNNGFGMFFTAMFSSSGSFIWGSYSKPGGVDGGTIGPQAVKIDNWGNTYETGYFYDTVEVGSIPMYAPNNISFFLIKYDAFGTPLWIKTSANNGYMTGNSLVTDSNGNVYVEGDFSGNVTIGSNSLSSTNGNIFVAKFDSTGNVLWITSPNLSSANSYAYSSGSSGDRVCKAIAIDPAENLYVTGNFHDTVIFGTENLSDSMGIYLVKYSSLGNVIWAKKSAPLHDLPYFPQPWSIACDNTNGVYLSGTFYGSINFSGLTVLSDSAEPSFLYKFDTSGAVLCGSAINNNNDDNNCVAADPLSNSVFFSGDIDIPFDSEGCYFGSYYLTGIGLEYGFLAKWTCDIEEGTNKISSLDYSISLFPNPSTGIFTFQSSVVSNQLSVEVYNVLGEKVYSSNYSLSTNHHSLNLSDQPNGIYLYRVLNADGSLLGEGKMIIQK